VASNISCVILILNITCHGTFFLDAIKMAFFSLKSQYFICYWLQNIVNLFIISLYTVSLLIIPSFVIGGMYIKCYRASIFQMEIGTLANNDPYIKLIEKWEKSNLMLFSQSELFFFYYFLN